MRETVWLIIGLTCIPLSYLATMKGSPVEGMILGMTAFVLCIVREHGYRTHTYDMAVQLAERIGHGQRYGNDC